MKIENREVSTEANYLENFENNELEKMLKDVLYLGEGYMLNGKHVPVEDVFIHIEKQTEDE